MVLFGTTIDPVTTSQQGKNARGAQILTNEGRAMKRGWLRKAVRAAPEQPQHPKRVMRRISPSSHPTNGARWVNTRGTCFPTTTNPGPRARPLASKVEMSPFAGSPEECKLFLRVPVKRRRARLASNAIEEQPAGTHLRTMRCSVVLPTRSATPAPRCMHHSTTAFDTSARTHANLIPRIHH